MKPAPRKHLNVALADDHALVRSGIRTILEAKGDATVVAEAEDGADLLRQLQDSDVEVDVVLMDLSMPGMDGITTIPKVRELHPSVRILVMTMHDSVDMVQRAIDLGACGYLTKDCSEFDLGRAMTAITESGGYFSPGVSQLLLNRAREGGATELTERQLEIVKLLATGSSVRDIGSRIGISARTVDIHRARIMQRLKLTSTAELTRYAIRQSLIRA